MVDVTPNQAPVRTVVASTDKKIAIEEYIDASGKVVRQSSFTIDQLNQMSANLESQYAQQKARIDSLIAVLS